MSEIITTTSVKINKQPKQKTSFVAETPLQKKKTEAKRMIIYAAGKYVECDTVIDGLLVCLAEKDSNMYYVVLDKDRQVNFVSIMDSIHVSKGPVPASYSILDWLKWHDTDSLVNMVESSLSILKYKAISPITVNWKKQFGPKDEKPVKNNNKKQNNKKY